jgi:hypothetical protein
MVAVAGRNVPEVRSERQQSGTGAIEMVMRGIVFAAMAVALGACASSAENIAAAYVSPTAYASWSCDQLTEEATRVSARAIQAAGTQNSKATNDAVATTVGAIVFWPALLFIKGDSTTGPELARLKGEMEAIEQASTRRNCGITFQRQAAS